MILILKVQLFMFSKTWPCPKVKHAKLEHNIKLIKFKSRCGSRGEFQKQIISFCWKVKPIINYEYAANPEPKQNLLSNLTE